MRAGLRRSHVATANVLRTSPERGPRSSSSSVTPVVVDANVLHGQLRRLVRNPGPTVLVSDAHSGYIRLFCARHVLDEADKYVESWALEAELDPLVARARWSEDIVPVLRIVDVPADLLTEAETERLLALCTDPDDRPTATLAILLGAPLLSRDKRPLRAVYGEQVDHLAHEQAFWPVLREVGDLGLLEELMRAAVTGVNLAGVGVAGGMSALRRGVPWQVLAGIAGAAIVAIGTRPRDRRQRVLQSVGRIGGALADGVSAASEVKKHAREALAPLVPQDGAPYQVQGQLDADRLLARAVLFALAWAPASQLTVAELSEAVADVLQLPWPPSLSAGLRTYGQVVRLDHGLVTLGRQVQA